MCAGASSRTRDLRNFAWIDDGAAQTSAASMSPRCSCPPTPLFPLRRCCRWRCARAPPDLGPTSPMCRLPSPPLGRVAGTGALAYRPLLPPRSRCAAPLPPSRVQQRQLAMRVNAHPMGRSGRPLHLECARTVPHYSVAFGVHRWSGKFLQYTPKGR